jgi:hypothetical protein
MPHIGGQARPLIFGQNPANTRTPFTVLPIPAVNPSKCMMTTLALVVFSLFLHGKIVDLSDKVLGEVLKDAAHVQVLLHGHPVVPGASMDI